MIFVWLAQTWLCIFTLVIKVCGAALPFERKPENKPETVTCQRNVHTRRLLVSSADGASPLTLQTRCCLCCFSVQPRRRSRLRAPGWNAAETRAGSPRTWGAAGWSSAGAARSSAPRRTTPRDYQTDRGSAANTRRTATTLILCAWTHCILSQFQSCRELFHLVDALLSCLLHGCVHLLLILQVSWNRPVHLRSHFFIYTPQTGLDKQRRRRLTKSSREFEQEDES